MQLPQLEIQTDTRQEPIEVRKTEIEDMPSLDNPGDDDQAHFVRKGHTHAICGVEVDTDTLGETADAIDCPACRGILQTFLNGGGWDGFGKRVPSQRNRKELEDLLGE